MNVYFDNYEEVDVEIWYKKHRSDYPDYMFDTDEDWYRKDSIMEQATADINSRQYCSWISMLKSWGYSEYQTFRSLWKGEYLWD